jgi:hypothetical protein
MRFSWLVLFIASWVSAAIVSTGVGSVRGQVITSREVQIQYLLEAALNGDHKEKLKILALDSKAFAEEVQDTLLEAVVSLEAQSFNVMELSNEEVKSAERKANKILKKSEAWKELAVAKKELDAALRRKLQSKKFIQFRAQSSVIPVTDVEAQKYFNENRLKFGNLPFENLKENIKSALSRTQVERRLKDWYDVLLNKYQVKNLIAEI